MEVVCSFFGIKGKKWDVPNYGVKEFKYYNGLMSMPYSNLYNKSWIKPLKSDTPETAIKVDGANYWYE